MKNKPNALILFAAMSAFASTALADVVTIDLSHPIPTFAPSADDPMKADLSKPYLDSVPIPTFGGQAILSLGEFPTSDGHFDLGTLVLAEHHGTHLDTPATTSTIRAVWSPVVWLPKIASWHTNWMRVI